MPRKKTDTETGLLKGMEDMQEQGKQVPRERWPDVAVIKNSDDAVKVKAFRLHLSTLLTFFTLKWGTRATLVKKRERWVTLWFYDNGDGTATARMRATPDIEKGSCLELRENGGGFSFRYRAVETDFDFVSVSGKHKVEVRDCRVVDTGSGRDLLVVFGIAAPIPVSVLARPYPRQPGKKCSAKGRKYNGRAKTAPKPVPKPVAAVAPPEQRTPPVSSWPESNVATPAVTTIPYAYGGLDARLEVVENKMKAFEANLTRLTETVSALKGSGVKTETLKPEPGFNETQKRQLGGIVKTVVIAQSRQSLEAEIERLKRVSAERNGNSVPAPSKAAKFFDTLKQGRREGFDETAPLGELLA